MTIGLSNLVGNLRDAYQLALAGSIGAIIGLYLYVEAVKSDDVWTRDALAGALIGGSIGYAINACFPLRDRAWIRLARDSSWGACAGSIGGMIGLPIGEWVLGAFEGGLIGRAFSWAILGLGIGLSQGAAFRSKQKLMFGILGGSIGGFLGGYCFEAIRSSLGERHDLGQGLGILLLGAGLGLGPALVEQAMRKAWVKVMNGRQEGRAYLLARFPAALGLNERADVGLFGDLTVAREHARIDREHDDYWLHDLTKDGRTKVNGDVLNAPRLLQDGDRVELGRTLVLFRRRG